MEESRFIAGADKAEVEITGEFERVADQQIFKSRSEECSGEIP